MSTRMPPVGSDDPQERAARALWSRIAEPYDELAQGLVQEHSFTELVGWAGGSGRTPDGVSLARFQARLAKATPVDEAHLCRVLGLRLLVPGDAGWPEQVDALEHPPWCLWVRGPARLDDLAGRSVAVVGSRASTAYGDEQTYALVCGLVHAGFAVVSGAAYGIDAAAHRAALVAGGRTVAVLAGGVDVPYPARNAGLLEQIARDGAVVSESPPGWAPARMRFLARNRTIAALATGTLLVEAGLRSGARTTVRHARELGRDVAVLPGPVSSVMSAGCHQEIRMGGTLVTDAAEVAELLGRIGADLAPVKQGPVRDGDGLPEDQRRVWQWLRPRRSSTVDEVCDRAGLTAREVLVALDGLAEAGLAEQRLDGWVRRGTS